jgi:hypothetical protein
MKKVSNIIFTLALFMGAIVLQSTSAFAQVPQKFNYQGIARDAKGNPLMTKQLALKLSVLPTADATVPEYEEIQLVTTNEFGLYTLQIGNGMATIGEMKTVKWETGNKYIRVAIDPNGGSNYVEAGTTQLLSVPYAIYADKAGVARETVESNQDTRLGAVSTSAAGTGTVNFITKFTAANTIFNSQLFDNGTNVGLGTTSPVAKFHIQNGPNADMRITSTGTGASDFATMQIFNDAGSSFGFTKASSAGGAYSPGIPRPNLALLANSGALLFNATGNIGFATRIGGTNFTRMIIDSVNGNVGIGTTAPTTKLEVIGQVKITGGAPGAGKVLTSDATGLATWTTPAAGGVASVNGATGAVVNSLTMGSAGTNTAVTGSGTNAVTINIPTANATNTGKLSNTDWTTFNNKLSGTVTTNLLPKSTGTNTMGNSQVFDNGTSVGVGTTTPNASAKLDVNGQVRISGGAPGAGKVLTSDATGLATWQTPAAGGGVTSVNGATGAVVNSVTMGSAGTNTAVTGSGTNAVTINIPTANATNTGKLSNTDWTAFNNKMGGTGTTNTVPKFSGASTLANSQITDDGSNVGVGIALPGAKLHVNGVIATGDNATTQGTISLLPSNAAGFFHMKNMNDNTLRFSHGPAAGANDLVTINTSGNMGIGTINPFHKLDVNGEAHIGSSPNFGSVINLSSTLNTPDPSVSFNNTNTGNAFNIHENADGQLQFHANNLYPSSGFENIMTLDDDTYNVGIGTENPEARLDISGTGVITASWFGNVEVSERINDTTAGFTLEKAGLYVDTKGNDFNYGVVTEVTSNSASTSYGMFSRVSSAPAVGGASYGLLAYDPIGASNTYAAQIEGKMIYNNGSSAVGATLKRDANGVAVWEGPVAFKASGYTGGTIAASTSINPVVYITENFDLSSSYDPATGIFIVPTSGIYHFDYSAEFVGNNTATSGFILIGLIKNNLAIEGSYIEKTVNRLGSYETINGSADVQLAAGDTINVQLSNFHNTTQSTTGDPYYCTFSGHIIR